MDKLKALIATNHLVDFGGSELIVFEFADFLLQKGYSVCVFANFSSDPMKSMLGKKLGLMVETDPSKIYPFNYNFVYFQHQVAGLFNYNKSENDLIDSVFIFGRLSRRSFLESGGWVHDNVLGNRTIANSVLTALHLKESKLNHGVGVFHNAAPSHFLAPPRKFPEKPERILIVTNHEDESLLQAVKILKSTSKNVLHIGKHGDVYRQVTPCDIKSADLVVSIGKTVQYALVARTPVFVYDHFGGPGYLNEDNFKKVALYSFSGRCCERKLTGDEIFKSIQSEYKIGVDFCLKFPNEILKGYVLDPYLEELLRISPTSNQLRRQNLLKKLTDVRRERGISMQIRIKTLESYFKQLK